jgi:hypothetical protein
VTNIGQYAFDGCIGLTSVYCQSTIPPTLTDNAFSVYSSCTLYIPCGTMEAYQNAPGWGFTNIQYDGDCSGQTSIVSDSLMFSDNSLSVVIGYVPGITNVIIPSSVVHIKDSAFYYCPTLRTVTMSNTVTTIGKSAFEHCINLQQATLSESISVIDTHVLKDCYALAQVNIPENVIELKRECFQNCSTALVHIELPSRLKRIEHGTFAGCRLIDTWRIPDSVTFIGEYAFLLNDNIEKLELGTSVDSICYQAFDWCYQLDTVLIRAINPPYLSNFAISNQSTLHLYVPCGTMEAYQNAPEWSSFTNIQYDGDCSGQNQNIPDSLIYLDTDPRIVIGYITGLTNAIIPNTVTQIDNSAFYNCSTLRTVTMSNSVTSIGPEAFFGCSNLSSVHFGNGLTTIGYRAFYNCTSLHSAILPDGLETIDYGAFAYCSSLDTLIVPSGAIANGHGGQQIYYTNKVFYNCSNLSYVFIGPQATVGTQAFDYCEINKLYYDAENMQNWADGLQPFKHQCQVDTVIIGKHVRNSAKFSGQNLTTILFNADSCINTSLLPLFGSSESVTNLTIGSNVKAIPDQAFSGLSGITQITIPDSVLYIGNTAFQNCSNLHQVNYNASMCNTAYRAFSGCHIDTISYGPNVNIIPIGLFYECSELTGVLTIPQSVTTIGDYAYSGCTGITEIKLLSAVPPVIASATFNGLPTNILITVPCGSAEIYQSAPFWNVYTNIVNDGSCYYNISTAINDSLHGLVLGGGDYPIGASAQLSVVPSANYHFTAWNDGNTNNPRYVNVSMDSVFTAYIEQVDTIFIHDTSVVIDTIYDTIYIHDTITAGVGEVKTIDAKVYQRNGQIVVEGADGNTVTLYDVSGRILATKRDDYMPLWLDVPAAGTYMVKIGDYPARRVVVIK